MADQEQQKGSAVVGGLLGIVVGAIQRADEVAARERVSALRQSYPTDPRDKIVERLIKRKAQQTAMVGAATSSASLIPGIGTFATLTLGTAADIGATFSLQAELVLEVAAAYEYELSQQEKIQTVLIVTGLSAGGVSLVNMAGRRVTMQLIERYGFRWLARAIPVLGMVASAGVNAIATYIIGTRAQAYFARGAEAMGDWQDNLRAITGVDERKIKGWLEEAGVPTNTDPQQLGDNIVTNANLLWQQTTRSAVDIANSMPWAVPPPVDQGMTVREVDDAPEPEPRPSDDPPADEPPRA